MFVDLVGSTELASRLDPEDMRDVIRAYQNTCAEAIARFERVAKYMGDGVLANLAGPRRMRTMPSAQCGPGWRSRQPWPDLVRPRARRCRRASALPPVSCWSET